MNDFREWVSDNLRYMLLGLFIVLAILALIFGIRFISNTFDGSGQKEGQKTEATPTPEATEAPTETPTATPEATPTETPTPAVEEELKKDADENVTALIRDYYTALGKRDVESVKKLVDNLDETEAKQIENAQTIEDYTVASVYTKKGITEGSYLVLAEFDYKLKGIDTRVPGLSALFVKTDETGKLYIATQNITDEEKTFYDSAIEAADVQKLVNEVKAKNEEALNSDAALKEAFEKIDSGE